MCKFCKLTTLNEDVGEKGAGRRLARIKDGRQIFDLYLNRYVVEDAGIHNSQLIIDLNIELDEGEYAVENKQVDIKYCPFCGKEL